VNKRVVASVTAVFFTLLSVLPNGLYAEDKKPVNLSAQNGSELKDTKPVVSSATDTTTTAVSPSEKPVSKEVLPVTETNPEIKSEPVSKAGLETKPDTGSDAASGEVAAPAQVVDPGSITVNFKGADIRTVLAYVSEVAGVDIVPAPDVKGVVD